MFIVADYAALRGNNSCLKEEKYGRKNFDL